MTIYQALILMISFSTLVLGIITISAMFTR
ncbi:putative holin-like toxin [Desulfosporosinus sp. SB140]